MTVSTTQRGVAAGRLIKAVAMAGGDPIAAAAYIEGQHAVWGDTPEVELRIKAAVDAMSTSDPGGLGSAIMVTGDFVGLVRDNTIIDRVANFRRVPLNIQIPAVTADANAHQVGEGIVKPLSKFSLGLLMVTPRKITASVVTTTDLIRRSSGLAERMLATELAGAVSAVANRRFLDPDAAGSITNGATVINSGGGSLAQLDADFKAMLKALAASGDEALTNAVWCMPSAVAIYLAGVRGTGGALAYPLITAKGGSLMGLPVFTTGALNATGSPAEYALALFDPQQILLGDEGKMAITVAQHATVELDDTPGGGANAVQTSLFQANLVAPRAERFLGWTRVSTASVVTLDNIGWA
jgi:HK97 family phage major capsid protein